jgi:phosphoribosylamine--glycine ligase/phosphoribosylaminoimidazole synthetase
MTHFYNPDPNLTQVLVVGTGCREAAICHALLTDPRHPALQVHTNSTTNLPHLMHPLTNKQQSRIIVHPLSDNPMEILELCKRERVGLVIPGPEGVLVAGLADVLSGAGIPCYGPTQANAQLESSKAYAKEILRKYGVAVPEAIEYTPDNEEELLAAIRRRSGPLNFVLKANGLAGGKGVIVPNSQNEALHGARELLIRAKTLMHHDRTILLEDRCQGEECSLIGFCDGKRVLFGPQAQDYKRLEDGDLGPNTGGMGAVCPVNVLSPVEVRELEIKLSQMVADHGYIGFLYVALMRTEPGGGRPLVIELNCRLGDPETQVLLPALSNGLLSVIMHGESPRWNPAARHMAVVVASADYCRRPMGSHDSAMVAMADQGQWAGKLSEHSGLVVLPGKAAGRMLTVVHSDYGPNASWASVCAYVYRVMSHPLTLGRGSMPFYRRDIGRRHAIAEAQSIRKTRGWTKPLRVAALCSGNGTSLRMFLDHLAASPAPPASVELVVSNRAGSIALALTRQRGIPTLYVPKREEHRLIAVLRAHQIDAVFLIGYDAIVGSQLIAEHKDKLINVHPSLLPRHAGSFDRNVHQAVLSAGDTHTGCTFHVVTDDVDQGPVVLQRQIVVPVGITVDGLKALVQEEEGEGLLELMEMLAGGSMEYSVDGVGADAVANHAAQEGITGFCGTWMEDKTGRLWGACTDGVGTKLTLALEEYRCLDGQHELQQTVLDNIAQDLVAMSVNDLMVSGGVPERFLDYIAVDRSDSQLCKGLITGVLKACERVGCQLVGGETAEMKGVYWPGECDLAGCAMGPILRKLPERSRMLAGQPVYALPASGPHSNGFTLIHSLLQKGVRLDRGALLVPTALYPDLPWLLEHPCVLGAAHITGGGVHANVQRILPGHLRLELDNAAWEWPSIFREIQKGSGLTDNGMLRVYNCGLGVLIVFEEAVTWEWGDNHNLIRVGTLVEQRA